MPIGIDMLILLGASGLIALTVLLRRGDLRLSARVGALSRQVGRLLPAKLRPLPRVLEQKVRFQR